jgi:autotransporter-associated beta strand protein
VTIFEKSARLCGRSATRIRGDQWFDHGAQYFTGGSGPVLNGGLTKLNGGPNTLLVAPTAGVPGLLDLRSSGSSVLDLNGNSQVVAQLLSINTMPRMGGTVASVAPATLTTASSNSQTFSGSITGQISLLKQGAGTLVLNGSNTYTGSTVVAGGGLTLRDGATLTSTSGWTVRYGTLTLDNTGLAAAPLSAPLGTGTLLLLGGSFVFKAMQGNDSTSAGSLSIGIANRDYQCHWM